MNKTFRCPLIEELPSPPPEKSGWPWTEGCKPLPDKMSNGKKWPKISIVTPSYHQGQFIEETIRSVLLQGYPNLEYIIIDGGSTDNTVKVLQKYEIWLTHWDSRKDKGQAHAINKGWLKSQGSILAWLNSDDVYAPNALSNIADVWCRAGQPGMIYGDALSTDVSLLPFKKKSMNDYSFRAMMLGKRMAQPAVFISRELATVLGPLNESLYYSLDFDYFLRAWLISDSQKFRYIPKVLAYSREYPGTKCKSGGSDRIEENVGVLRKIWHEQLRLFHDSRDWRLLFALGLTDLAKRYLKSGSLIKAIILCREACKWSPKVISNVGRTFLYFAIKKLRTHIFHCID